MKSLIPSFAKKKKFLTKHKGYSAIMVIALVFSLVCFTNSNFSSVVQKAFAAITYNLSGWSWSDNVGWVSMNSNDCDADGNGFTDTGKCGGDNSTTVSKSYGVNIATTTGVFSGYGWSENIGWVNFAPAGPYPEVPNHGAQLLGNTVTGWARACAGTVNGDCTGADRTDGWDGWIKMSGVTIGATPQPYGIIFTNGIFSGYAWGSNIVGWLSLNGTNFNSGSGLGNNISVSISPNTNQTINAGDTINFSTTATDPSSSLVEHHIDIRNPDGTWTYNLTGQSAFAATNSHSILSYNFTPSLTGTYIVKSAAKNSTDPWVDSAWITVTVGSYVAPNGVCGTVKYTCVNSTSINNSSTATTWTWGCQGTVSTASCEICQNGDVNPPTCTIASSVTVINFSGTPTSISKGGSTVLSWDITGLSNSCKITAVDVANGMDVTSSYDLNGNTDANDPSGQHTMLAALTTNISGGHALGKKTITGINYPIEFKLDCGGTPSAKKVRVNITSSVEG